MVAPIYCAARRAESSATLCAPDRCAGAALLARWIPWIHLTIGIFLLLAATATFGGLFQNIETHDWFVAADLRVATWFADHSGVVVSQLMSSLAKLASPYWLVALF